MATFTLYLPDGLVEDLDAVRGGTSRSKWIRGAVSERLGLPHDELHVPVVGKPPSPSSPRSPTAGREVEALAESGAPQRALEAAAARDIAHTLRTEPSVFEPPPKGHPGHKQPCKCLNCERARGNVS